ncbi:hypothetical protein SacmaDRAFT_3726 [Saccharomonospora marina XMU15]|uniref:HTH tetR-type domain-containing protein n=1 Tax=Saccharomonospora marina XMU15 TaxID=882083 RepID=H5X0T9_9PSEU|nr:TetR/AcrR family transcriptional regulator [Saccharomonospora marina]EHR51939.1 hypothetical protein SacmaDRAFT_3726 [Saccharomonospora marina XMU15]
MPKVVDHEQRRRELARAVWQVIRERGIEAASVRAVAAKAGWSHGSVQYYFSTQAELLNFAMSVITDEAEQRVDRMRLPTDPIQAALAVLERLLPLDPDARTANELWVAFLSRVLVDPAARELNTAGNERLAGLLRDQLWRLDSAGLLPAGLDLELEADRLHALFDGIALQAVTDPARMTPALARKVIGYHVETLLRSGGTR